MELLTGTICVIGAKSLNENLLAEKIIGNRLIESLFF